MEHLIKFFPFLVKYLERRVKPLFKIVRFENKELTQVFKVRIYNPQFSQIQLMSPRLTLRRTWGNKQEIQVNPLNIPELIDIRGTSAVDISVIMKFTTILEKSRNDERWWDEYKFTFEYGKNSREVSTGWHYVGDWIYYGIGHPTVRVELK